MAYEPKKTQIGSTKLDRRQFMRMTVVGGGAAALLSACAVPAQTPTGDAGAAAAGGEGAASELVAVPWSASAIRRSPA